MPMNYPWFEIVTDNSLEQGDLFFACKILQPQFELEAQEGEELEFQASVNEYDVIVISQSCDLVQGKIETVLVCPVSSIDVSNLPKDKKEKIRQGYMPGYHMIASCDIEGFQSAIRIVNFRQVFSLPFGFIQNLSFTQNPRLRLLPPYREHMAQAFARFIMRIGLPVDIPPFK